MRTIINYIRQVFCAHDFKFEEGWMQSRGEFGKIVKSCKKISRTCQKCGWHKSYWKY